MSAEVCILGRGEKPPMRRNAFALGLLIGAVSLTSSAQSPAPQDQRAPQAASAPVNVVLADGTQVKLRLGSSTASASVRIGEDLELEVAEDVRIAGVAVIAKGSYAIAAVTGLHAGVGSGPGGRIDLNLRSVTLADGQVVPVRATKERPIRNDQAMVVSSASQDASIAPGTFVTAFIDGSQPLDLIRMRAAGGPRQELKITSTPETADVSVDGHLTGTTPYVFQVPAGDHIVSVRMAGYQPSERTVRVAAAAVAVEIPLIKLDGAEAMPAAKAAEPSLGELARAARARKASQNPPPAADRGGQPPANTQTSQRDPMEPPTPRE